MLRAPRLQRRRGQGIEYEVSHHGRPCSLPSALSFCASCSSLSHVSIDSGSYRAVDLALAWRKGTIAARYCSFFRPVGTALRFSQALIVESLIVI